MTPAIYYILDGQQVVATDAATWSAWFATANRHVASDHVGPYWVSTVFLGVNHRFAGSKGPPLVFETMAFLHGDSDGECHRYSSWDDAVTGHAALVHRLQAALSGRPVWH